VTGIASNTITLGRAAGFLFLVVGMRFLLGTWAWIRQSQRLALVLVAATTLLFSGSRGPLLAAFFALLLTLFIDRRSKTFPRLAILAGLVSIGLASAWSFVPAGSLARIISFATGDFGGSALTRQVALDKAIPQILTHPLGIGWGGFMGQIHELAGQARQYPHNLLAEAFLEGGWLTGFGIVYLVFASRARMARSATREDYALWMGLFLFFFFNALVSGDINDNRIFFTVLGLGIGTSMGNSNDGTFIPDGVRLDQP
jgi:O-antigen ligase